MSTVKVAVISVVSVSILAVLALVIFIASFDWNRARPWIAKESERYTGRTLAITGKLDVDLGWHPHLRAERVSFENADWGTDPHMFAAKVIDVKMNLGALLDRTLEFTRIQLEDGHLIAETNEDGVSNFALNPKNATDEQPGAAKPAEKARKSSFKLNPELVSVKRFTVESRPYGETAKKLEIANLDLKTGLDARRVTLDGNAQFAGLPITVRGQVDEVDQLALSEGTRPFKLAVKVADLLANASGKIGTAKNKAGELAMNLSGHADAKSGDLKKIAAALGLKLTGPVPKIDVATDFTLDGALFSLTSLDAQIGASDVRGKVALDTRSKVPHIDTDLDSNTLRWDDFKGFMPEKAAAELPKERAEKVEKTGEAKQLFSPKPIPFNWMNKLALKADIDVKNLVAPQVLSVVHAVAVNVDLRGGKLNVDPLKVGLAGGTLEAKQKLDATKADDPKLEVSTTLNHVDLGKMTEALLQGTAVEGKKIGRLSPDQLLTGKLAGRIDLNSHGVSVDQLMEHLNGRIGLAVEDGAISSLLVEALGFDLTESAAVLLARQQTTPLQCMVVDLKVNNGLVEPNAFLIGTKDSNIFVKGKVDLGSESLAASIRTVPTDFSIGALNTPIEIKGSLAKPRLDVQRGELLARAAAAALLGTLATPAAAVIPFIEPGLGKSGACRNYTNKLAGIEQSADQAPATH